MMMDHVGSQTVQETRVVPGDAAGPAEEVRGDGLAPPFSGDRMDVDAVVMVVLPGILQRALQPVGRRRELDVDFVALRGEGSR